VLKSIFCFCILFILSTLICVLSYAQNYQWAKNMGGGNNDFGRNIYTDNKGFLYVVGFFEGSNIDFDPSPTATAYLSGTAGSRDAFVAKYTTSGQYVWAFKIGGSNLDEANAITVDPQGNVYVTGYFRGQNVDFDPSSTGTALLNSNGEQGGDPGYGGDIFIAKYNSGGQYQWAFNIGSTSLGDNGMVITCDNAGNIYTSGYFFSGVIDFDPSPAIHNLDASSGTIYVAKYNTSGQYQWAFNVGKGTDNNSPFGIKIDASANIYLTGYFQGTNMDFDPSASSANITSKGGYDIFVAKYNSLGQYQWAFDIGGPGQDVGRDIEIDNSGNVYVVGDFDGSNIDFDPSPSGTANLSSNSRDVFLAKYNNNGQYQWAKRFGGSGSDISWSLAYSDNNIYITGSFQGTMDFSPGPGTDNLLSNGGNDFYMTKFDLNGNYRCAFSVGGAGNDDGYRLAADNVGNLYVTGMFASSNTDFNPTSATNLLGTNGASDIFVAKYDWPENVAPTGTILGNSICSGQQAQLTFTAVTGVAPFTLQLSNGSTTFTQTNVQSGVPFSVSPSPVVTTKYTLLSIKDATRCSPTNSVTGIAANITVGVSSTVNAGADIKICEADSASLNATGTGVVTWTPTKGLSNPNIANPKASPNSTTNYIVTLTNGECVSKDSVIVSVDPKPVVTKTRDTAICRTPGNTQVPLSASGGVSYVWSPAISLNATNIPNPVASPMSTTLYYVEVTASNGCKAKDSVLINMSESPKITAINDTSICEGTSLTLSNNSGTPGVTYSWFPSAGLTNSAIANPIATPSSSIAYVVTASVAQNCSTKDTVTLTVLASPAIIKSNDTMVCIGKPVPISVSGGIKYLWTPSAGLSNSTAANTVATVNSNTTYKVLVTGSNGCKMMDSIRIDVTPLPIFAISPTFASICIGDTIPVIASGGDSYQWIEGIIGNSSMNSISPMSNTTYKVKISDSTCEVTDTLSTTVRVNSLPTITLNKSNNLDCFFGKAQLIATGGIKYLWSPSATLSNANVSNPVASPVTTTSYLVRVTNTAGCSKVDSIEVTVERSANPSGYYLPNAFTPNNDGKNDCFGIKSWGIVLNIEFSIFNRWGQRVFHSTNPFACWDGTYKNILQDSGTFIYYIKAKTMCGGDLERKGTLEVIR
jgi:gliding motility-associated-like protein